MNPDVKELFDALADAEQEIDYETSTELFRNIFEGYDTNAFFNLSERDVKRVKNTLNTHALKWLEKTNKQLNLKHDIEGKELSLMLSTFKVIHSNRDIDNSITHKIKAMLTLARNKHFILDYVLQSMDSKKLDA